MKVLKFLFGWFYDFDTPKNNDNEMTDKEGKEMMKDFDKLRFKKVTGKKEWFVKK